MNRGCHDGSAPRNDESHCQLQYNQQLPGGKFIIQKMLKKFQFNLSADKSAGDEDAPCCHTFVFFKSELFSTVILVNIHFTLD